MSFINDFKMPVVGLQQARTRFIYKLFGFGIRVGDATGGRFSSIRSSPAATRNGAELGMEDKLVHFTG